MRHAAVLVALVVMLAGAVGVVSPNTLAAIRQYAITPWGLLGIAALRSAIGIVLVMVAPASRAPRSVRACGGLLLLAGLVTPLFGVERSRAVVAWEIAQGTAFIRAAAALIVVIGGLLAFAVSRRRAVVG
jgi:hypothetical protein